MKGTISTTLTTGDNSQALLEVTYCNFYISNTLGDRTQQTCKHFAGHRAWMTQMFFPEKFSIFAKAKAAEAMNVKQATLESTTEL